MNETKPVVVVAVEEDVKEGSVLPWDTFIQMEAALLSIGDSFVAQAVQEGDREQFRSALKAIQEAIGNHTLANVVPALAFALCAAATEVWGFGKEEP